MPPLFPKVIYIIYKETLFTYCVGLSRPTVPETIDEDMSGDEVEESAADPTAQAIYNLVHGDYPFI